ncbi:cytosol aminopeptidase-like [Daktulosphaira vitifoliae]|uniref:cytosol aminopeptidase-like n=1 Tax=Daktulosphaira vitifoliae TaxID=58002 RepID=UPI0021A97A3F|nr:cytosol aminopeptidase-like [Daktulosphaira vitifoliae]
MFRCFIDRLSLLRLYSFVSRPRWPLAHSIASLQSKRCFAAECKSSVERNGLVLGVYQEDCSKYEFSEEAVKFNDKLSGLLGELLSASPIQPGDARLFNISDKDYRNVAIANVGERNVGYDENEQLYVSKENIRQAFGKATVLLDNEGCNKIFADGLNSPETVAEAAVLAAWKFEGIKTMAHQPAMASIEPYNKDHKDSFDRGTIFAKAQNVTRMLTEIPGNVLTPTVFGECIVKNLHGRQITVDVHDRDWMESKKLFGVLEAAKGSCEPPLFAVMSYCGGENVKPLALVGHATTYDTGGICMRDCHDMVDKKRHVASGATLVGLMKGIAELTLPVNVYAYVPLFENGTSGSGIKTADTYYALNGKSVNVDNTKFISRLAVADTITYACNTKPEALINVCTLCGVTHRVFGELAAPVFTNQMQSWEQVKLAGAITGDRAWLLPSYERKTHMITRDEVADVAVMGEGGVKLDDLGKSAAFVAQFVTDPKLNFTHIDIGGVYCNTDEVTYPYLRKQYATGRLTRTLLQMIYQMYCPHSVPKK